jgi:hypothetical protein
MRYSYADRARPNRGGVHNEAARWDRKPVWRLHEEDLMPIEWRMAGAGR